MAEKKSKTSTVRVHQEVKDGLKTMAEKARRSLANMVAVLIQDHCERTGIAIPEQQPFFKEGN